MSGKIDEAIDFIPVGIAVMTISDTRIPDDDESGDILAERISGAGHDLITRTIIHDDTDEIQAMLKLWIENPEIDAVISTGGTGVTERDVTPEAFLGIFDKEIEGFGEMFRAVSMTKIGTSAMQSRAVGGVAGGTYLFALPGSPSACKDGWDDILKYQLDIRYRPCNFVEIMPRLMEKKAGGRSG
jgi:molybdenum cofactor biosynthesis protein B